MKKALITGITGQDGSYLAEHLLSLDYEVHGTIRRSSSINTSRIDHLISKYSNDNSFNLHYSDLLDPGSMKSIINKIKPDEIYNLAAQSHVAVSFKVPQFSVNTSTTELFSLLEAARNSENEIKFYQASSSEMYGGINNKKLNEESLLEPKSPYAVGKLCSPYDQSLQRVIWIILCKWNFV